jgi:hypothetical protein
MVSVHREKGVGVSATSRRRDLTTTARTSDLARRQGAAARPPATPVREFVRPKWLLTHLLMLVLAVTMILLGRWQLDVSNTKHFDLQNFAYAFQWWIFTGFVVFFWVKLVRNTRRPPVEKDTRLVMRTESGDHLDDGRYRGLAQLVVPDENDGGTRVSYVGYVMPRSAASPARSDGDRYHAAYNDMLWGLAAADSQQTEPPEITAAPKPRIVEAGGGPEELDS